MKSEVITYIIILLLYISLWRVQKLNIHIKYVKLYYYIINALVVFILHIYTYYTNTYQCNFSTRENIWNTQIC